MGGIRRSLLVKPIEAPTSKDRESNAASYGSELL